MAHKSFASLKRAVLAKAKKGMKENVLPIVRETMQASIQKEVYSVYDPVSYKRREYNGGLIADKNIVGFISDRSSGFDYQVGNITMPKSIDAPQSYLTPLIVMGQLEAIANGYPLLYHHGSELLAYGKQRDFISATINKLDKRSLSSSLERYMNKR
jgi:hypothetical protein